MVQLQGVVIVVWQENLCFQSAGNYTLNSCTALYIVLNYATIYICMQLRLLLCRQTRVTTTAWFHFYKKIEYNDILREAIFSLISFSTKKQEYRIKLPVVIFDKLISNKSWKMLWREPLVSFISFSRGVWYIVSLLKITNSNILFSLWNHCFKYC